MKTILTFLSVLISIGSLAQNGINYKAVIKDDSGNVLASSAISIQFTIYEGAALTNNVYLESHTINTDVNGFVAVNIGEGTTSNVFADIAWGNDTHFLNVQVNTGSGLVDMGTTEFKAVPYALSSADNYWSKQGSAIYNENEKIGIGTNTPDAKLEIKHSSSTLNPHLTITEDAGDYARLTFKNGNTAINNSYWTIAGKVEENLEDNRLNIWNGTSDLLSITGDGKVGIGVGALPLTDFHLGDGKSALIGYAFDGFGTKLFWSNEKAAFRAGVVDNDQWDNMFVGDNSFASGNNTIASGLTSSAFGFNTIAAGNSSIAVGEYNVSNFNALLSVGNGTETARQDALTVLRNGTITAPSFDLSEITDAKALTTKEYVDANAASGLEAINEGDGIGWRLEGRDPTDYLNIGENAVDLSTNFVSIFNGRKGASGNHSTAMGYETTASGNLSTTMGQGTKAESFASLAIGRYNVGGGSSEIWEETDPLFEVGNGTKAGLVALRRNAFTVLKNGNVGIGTSTPIGALQINYNSSINSGHISLYETGADYARINFTNTTRPSSYWAIAGLMGSTVSADRLNFYNSGVGDILSIHGTGNVFVNGVLAHSSDRRLKTDIAESEFGLEHVMQLRPKTYYWKDKPNQNRRHIGLIAQDVQDVIKSLVHQGDDADKTLSVSYTELIPILIKALQEQQGIINRQEDIVMKQSKEFKELQERMEILESKND